MNAEIRRFFELNRMYTALRDNLNGSAAYLLWQGQRLCQGNGQAPVTLAD